MDPRELDRLGAAFTDAAGTAGMISQPSFQQAMDLQSDKLAQHLFRLFDRDGNGSIERGEFMAALESVLAGTAHEKLGFLFRVHDQDDDGAIARGEVEQLIKFGLAESGVELPTALIGEMVDAFFERADANGDGQISFDEFSAVFNGFPALLDRVTQADSVWRTIRQRGAAEPTEVKLPPLRRAAHFIENHGVEFAFLTAWIAINLALFAGAVVRYHEAGANGLVQLARGCGACLNFNAALVLVPMLRRFLSWLRAQRIARLVPVDHAVAFHKLIGHALFGFALVHTAAHFGNYAISTAGFADQLFGTAAGLSGFVLLVVFVIMWVFAREPVRRAGHFELFHATHLLYVAFVPLLLWHGPVWWMWAALPLVGYVVERILRERTRANPVTISTEVLPSRVTKLSFAPPPDWRHRAGDYLFIKIPAIARFEWHPFTISCAPERENELTLHIRSLGNWTTSLAKLAGERGAGPAEPLVGYIDGPYGTPSADIFGSGHVVLIGAGIGVTPFAAILDSLLHRRRSGEPSAVQVVHFVWINRDQFAFEWFSDLLSSLEAADTDKLLDIRIYMTGGREQLDAAALEIAREVFYAKTHRDVVTGLGARTQFGRPDWEELLTGILRQHAPEPVEVFMCGPHVLGKELAGLCNKLGMGFHEEVF